MLRRAALFACFALAPAAPAQLREFRLGDDGRWVERVREAPSADEAAVADARRRIAEDNPDAALTILDEWIEGHRRTDHALLPEAYLLRGDARTAAGDEWWALFDYETLVKGFPGSPEFVTALERELEIAVRYVNGLRRKQWGMRWVGAVNDGEELLVRVQERLPGSRLAERAAIELADSYHRRNELEQAAEMYAILLRRYPRSEYRRRAMVRLVDTQVRRFHGPKYDARGLREARDLVEDFRASWPADADQAGLNEDLLNRIDEQLAAQVLERARFYDRRGDPVSSRFTLRRVIEKHPGTVAATTALQTLRDRGWAFEPSTPAPTAAGPTPAATPTASAPANPPTPSPSAPVPGRRMP